MAEGERSQKGGHRKYFRLAEWASKKIEKVRVGVKNISPQKFSPRLRHFLLTLIHLPEYLNTYIISTFLLLQNTIVSMCKSGRRKIIARCRVGCEVFTSRAEWAAKIFPVKTHLTPLPPVISNDQSIREQSLS